MEAEINALGQDPEHAGRRARRRDPRARDDRARAPGRSRSRRGAAPPGARRRSDARGGARALRRSLPRAPRLARPHRPLRVRARQRARGRRRRPTSWCAASRRSRSSPSCGSATSPRAIDAWQRIAELEPDSPKVAEALRRLTARSQDVAAARREPRARGRDRDAIRSQRTHVLKKMAQTYRERQIDPRRAIELYEQVIAENPDDDQTLKALAELYEREGDDAGLAQHAAPACSSSTSSRVDRGDARAGQARRRAEGVAGREARRAADAAAPARAALRDAARRRRRRGLRVAARCSSC